jgi:hypothetical protein
MPVFVLGSMLIHTHRWTYNGIEGGVGVEPVPGLARLGIVASRASGVVQRRSSIMRSTRSAWDDMRRRDRSAHAQRRLVSATQCRVTSAPQRQSTRSIAMMPLLDPGRPCTMTTAVTMTTTMTITPTATTRSATGPGGTCNTLSARFITRSRPAGRQRLMAGGASAVR